MKHIQNEDELYQLIKTWCPQPYGGIGVGDDAAVVKTGNNWLVATTDSLIEYVHFKSHWITPEYLGRKAVLSNLSDFSAMGASPRFALVSLILPKKYKTKRFLKKMYVGLTKKFSRHNIIIVGGNTSSGTHLSIVVTLLGIMNHKPLTRSGGHPGDLIFCTGNLGAAAYELSMLLSGKQHRMRVLPPDRLVFAQQLTIRNLASSAIDLSDGLSQSLIRLCAASKVGAKLYEKKLPISPSLLAQIVTDKQQDRWIIHGGESYELLFTTPKTKLSEIQKLAEKTSTPVHAIGELLFSGESVLIEKRNGATASLVPKGWDHLQTR